MPLFDLISTNVNGMMSIRGDRSISYIYSRILKTPHHIVSVFSRMVLKIEPTPVDYLSKDQMKSVTELNLISNFYVISDDVTLVEPLSNDFTNRLFMVSISILIDYVHIVIANSYYAFEAFSISIRSSSIDIVKNDVVFLDKILRPHLKLFHMRVLDYVLDGLLTFTLKGVSRICLHENHIKKDEMLENRFSAYVNVIHNIQM